MRKLITNFLCVVIFIILPLTETIAQSCFYPDPNIIPISRYEEGGGNAKLQFDRTKQQFARMRHLDDVTFISNLSTLIVDISFKAAITGNLDNNQTILSQDFNNDGWFIFYRGSDDKKIYFYTCSPGVLTQYEMADNSQPLSQEKIFRIVYNKSANTLRTYINDVWNHEHLLTAPFTVEPTSAFGIGARNLSTDILPGILGSDHLTGTFDDLIVIKDGVTIADVNFNWGAGQYVMDKGSFFNFDRDRIEDPLGTSLAFMLGQTGCQDIHDPTFDIQNISYPVANFTTLGTGFWGWQQGKEQYLQVFQANSISYGSDLYVTGNHNRVNVSPTSPNYDVSNGISKWNESQQKWQNVGSGFVRSDNYLNAVNNHVNVWNNKLIVVGFNNVVNDFPAYTVINGIAFFDLLNPTEWKPLTDQITGGVGLTNLGGFEIGKTSGFVTADYNGGLVVGGSFAIAGSVPASNIAIWNGSTWSALGSGLGGGGDGVFALAVYNNELYAGGVFIGDNIKGLAKWNTSTGTWVSVDFPTEAIRRIQAMHVFDDKLWVVGSFKYINGIVCHGIASWNGSNWSNINPGEIDENKIGLGGQSYLLSEGVDSSEGTDIVSANGKLYVCGSFTRINNNHLCNKVAKFDGTNWCAIGWGVELRPEGLSIWNNSFGNSYLVITGDLYSADGMDVNNIALFDINSDDNPIMQTNKNNMPTRFALLQNYPNPFNPKTIIKFQVASSSSVKVVVFDVLGREVSLLVNSKLEAGKHEAIFDGTNYPSGIYFYRIEAGDFVDSKKMILLK